MAIVLEIRQTIGQKRFKLSLMGEIDLQVSKSKIANLKVQN